MIVLFVALGVSLLVRKAPNLISEPLSSKTNMLLSSRRVLEWMPATLAACFLSIIWREFCSLFWFLLEGPRYPIQDLPGALSLLWFLVPYAVSLSVSMFTRKVCQYGNAARQRWISSTLMLHMVAFVCVLAVLCIMRDGPVTWIANWLLSSGLDANLGMMKYGTHISLSSGMSINHDRVAGAVRPMDEFISSHVYLLPNSKVIVMPPPAEGYRTLVRCLALLLGSMLLFPVGFRVASLLTAFQRRLSVSPPLEAFLEAFAKPAASVTVKAKHPLIINVLKTAWWFTICYILLFALIGFSEGPLGTTICNWLSASMVDARLKPLTGLIPINADKTVFVQYMKSVQDAPQLRIFLASIFALYGAAPLAVTACIFLPYAKTPRISMDKDGICFPLQIGFFGSAFRLWSDVKSVELTRARAGQPLLRRTVVIRFHSGSAYRLDSSCCSPGELDQLLSAIDENADSCSFSDEVLALRQEINDSAGAAALKAKDEYGGLKTSAFTSTVFVPKAPGSVLDNRALRIVKQIASKPLCAVYLARQQKQPGMLVVVKQFHLAEDNEETRAMRKIFEREYELLSRMQHPRMARVLEVFTDGPDSYLVIENIRGTDLRNHVTEHGSRPESLVRQWAVQLCDLMIELHEKEPAILHRDLTPDNVMLNENGEIILIDFGAAHQFLESVTGTVIGKKCYVAAEQLRGHASPRSDIYSFGCTLYFLLAGKDPVALKESDTNDFKVSKQLCDLIKRCTAFDEKDRPQTFRAIRELLQAETGTAVAAVETAATVLSSEPVCAPACSGITDEIHGGEPAQSDSPPSDSDAAVRLPLESPTADDHVIADDGESIELPQAEAEELKA